MRLLFADDIPDNRLPFATYFRLFTNWEVSFAESGAEAWAMYESAVRLGVPFDCVVLDIAMPDMSGLKVAQQIRATGDMVPIIFFTAYDRAPNRHGAEDVQAAAYLTKPLTSQELQAEIERVLK